MQTLVKKVLRDRYEELVKDCPKLHPLLVRTDLTQHLVRCKVVETTSQSLRLADEFCCSIYGERIPEDWRPCEDIHLGGSRDSVVQKVGLWSIFNEYGKKIFVKGGKK